MGEDNDETSASDSDESGSGDQADSFIQVNRNIDDDNAQAAEMARMEDQAAQADNIMGGDDDETPQNESKEQGSVDEADSFMQVIQAKRNIDDDNVQAAEMAHMEDQADKIMSEDDDDETSGSNGSERSTDEEDSFIQVKRNIDDDNAQAAEMARMEDQADKTLSDDDSQIAEDSQSDEQSEEGE